MGGELYLEEAEKALYKRLSAEVEAGKYDAVEKILDIMERLSLI